MSPIPDTWWPTVWAWLRECPAMNFDMTTPETYDAFVARHQANIETGGQNFGLTWEGVPAGAVWYIPHDEHVGLLHVCVARSAWGQHLVELAGKEIAERLMTSGVDMAVAQMYLENEAVIALCRRLGFVDQGVVEYNGRKMRSMAMTSAAWIAKEKM